ncbi:MAG TPA: DUF6348 family protein [Actinocrinis sp.]|nr:DUF6348 family protein [Actinocrinis sp.]
MDSTELPAPAEAGTDESEPASLPDEQILEIVGEHLAELSGYPWTLQPGPLLKGPGTVGVRIAAPDVQNFRHVDLEILLNVDNPEETGLVDCTSGLAAEPREAIGQAVSAWCDTTACVALEVLEQQGRYARHFPPDAAEGFPGWHTIAGGICGWGFGADARAKQAWFHDSCPWTALAPEISAGLDRRYLNGIRLFVGQGGDFQSCEVKINGRLHAPSTAALAELDWPRTERMSTARIFLLLVHQEESGPE